MYVFMLILLRCSDRLLLGSCMYIRRQEHCLGSASQCCTSAQGSRRKVQDQIGDQTHGHTYGMAGESPVPILQSFHSYCHSSAIFYLQ
jgi:hypothetical protein